MIDTEHTTSASNEELKTNKFLNELKLSPSALIELERSKVRIPDPTQFYTLRRKMERVF